MQGSSRDLTQILGEIHALTELWSRKDFDNYRAMARRILQDRAETIRAAAETARPDLTVVRCVVALHIIVGNLAESTEEVHRQYEDLTLEVMDQFQPTRAHEVRRHSFQKYTTKSNIFKRRAFIEEASQNFDLAVTLFEEAVLSAKHSLEFIDGKKLDGASKHLNYLRFHAAICRMRSCGVKADATGSRAAWMEGCVVAEDPRSPENLFPNYFFDRSDLKAYCHLIDAQDYWLRGDLRAARDQYDAWLHSVPQHKGRWRFRNVEVRRNLAEILICLDKRCGGCELCQKASEVLEDLTTDRFLGSSGRYLAQTGLALHQVGKAIPKIKPDQETIMEQLRVNIPLDYFYPQIDSKVTSGDAVYEMPAYFRFLKSEVARLNRLGLTEAPLRDFISQRLSELLELICEYEEGRAVLIGGESNSLPLEETNAIDLCERIIKARLFRKGAKDQGVSLWRSVSRQLGGYEVLQSIDGYLDNYASILTKVSLLFPTIVRVHHRERTEAGYSAVMETMMGEELRIDSQFALDGYFAYLPPRFRRNPVTLKLRYHDKNWWVPAQRVEGMYVLQAVALWDSDWSELGETFESVSIDYKQQLPKRLAKHLAAFANTIGGYLVFGVGDPGRDIRTNLRGLTLREAAEILDQVGTALIRELVPASVPTKTFRAYPSGKLVILCRVDRSPMRPHLVNGVIYQRIGTQSMPVSEETWNTVFAGA